MIFLKFVFGILFFFLGWMYLYRSNLVLILNRIAREVLFNDRRILLDRKKLSIIFFCLSFVALFMAFSSLTKWVSDQGKDRWANESTEYLMYMAMQDYCTERYTNAIEKYNKILITDPNNAAILKRLAYTYDANGEKKKARQIWKKLLRMNPNDQESKENYPVSRNEKKR